MTIVEQIKLLSGGINGTVYDEAINLTVSVARAELVRAGVNKTLANADEESIDPLIRQAIVTYGISKHSVDSTEIERAENAFNHIVDNLRKSSSYMEDSSSDSE